MLIAFGIHGFFEGIAVGSESEIKSICMFSFAIILHKGPAVISMGSKFVSQFPDDEAGCIRMLCIFTSFSPLGILFGIFLSQFENNMIEFVTSSLAAGTFLYIACTEVIPEQFVS